MASKAHQNKKQQIKQMKISKEGRTAGRRESMDGRNLPKAPGRPNPNR